MLDKIFASRTDLVFDLIKALSPYKGTWYTDLVNYLYLPNYKSNLLLQAHVDTLRGEGEYKEYKLYLNDGILTSNGILGADDRAGVFAIMYILKKCFETQSKAQKEKLERPSVLFTTGEESGGKGMGHFIKEYSALAFKHIELGVSIDRKNSNDFVSYVDNPSEIDDYIKTFGFKEATGTYSDIKNFSEHTLIPSVNVSIGYYSQHTASEHLHIDEMFMTINRILRIMKRPIDKLYQCKKEVYVYPRYNAYIYGHGVDGVYGNHSDIYDKDGKYIPFMDRFVWSDELRRWTPREEKKEEEEVAKTVYKNANGELFQQKRGGYNEIKHKRRKIKPCCELCGEEDNDVYPVRTRYNETDMQQINICDNCSSILGVSWYN